MHKKEVFRDCLAKMAKLMSKPLAYHCLKGSVTMQKQLLCGCFPIATEESFYCLFYCPYSPSLKGKDFPNHSSLSDCLSNCVWPFIWSAERRRWMRESTALCPLCPTDSLPAPEQVDIQMISHLADAVINKHRQAGQTTYAADEHQHKQISQ